MELRLELDTPYDENGDVSWLEQTPAQLGSITWAVANLRRLKGLERGAWHLVGVRVKATVTLGDGSTFSLTSPGVWSVESDSSDEYFWEIADSEMVEYMVDALVEIGFRRETIRDAYDSVRPALKV